MAKVVQSGRWSMPKNSSIPSGIKVCCDSESGVDPECQQGCGAVIVTEGNEKTEVLKNDLLDVGWVIICPQCDRGLKVYHPNVDRGEIPKVCFVATCCFGDINAPEVDRLRRWRDETLVHFILGRRFIRWYYAGLGEFLAAFVGTRPSLRRLSRGVLSLFVRCLAK